MTFEGGAEISKAGLWNDGDSTTAEVVLDAKKTVRGLAAVTREECGNEFGSWATGLAITEDGSTWTTAG